MLFAKWFEADSLFLSSGLKTVSNLFGQWMHDLQRYQITYVLYCKIIHIDFAVSEV